MTSWVAVAFGALDLRGTPAESPQAELAVTPVFPGEPVVMAGAVAELWRSLVTGPIDDADLPDEQRVLVREFADYGIAAGNCNHPDRVTTLDKPWLSSPTHELVYALVAKVADAEGIPAVFIKGPVLHAQGLRDREHSGDVDVWVEPGLQEHLARALTPWGWVRYPRSALTDTVLVHSVPMHAPGWGCEVDIHYSFPGIGLDPHHAFYTLNRGAELRTFAGTPAVTPDVTSSAVIAALHALRPRVGRPLLPNQLPDTVDILTRAGESVIIAAARYGTTQVLAPAMRLAFPRWEIPNVCAPLPPNWVWRTAPTVAASYVRALGLTEWHRRPGVMFRLVWPRGTYSRTVARELERSAKSPPARFARLLRGIRQATRGGGEAR